MQKSFFSNVSFIDKLLFTKHLSVMIKSGATLTESLSVLIEQTKSNTFKKVLEATLSDIENGQSFTKALEKHPKIFDQFYISLISVGEESGKLEENLNFLAKQLAKDYSLSKKIQGAMIYPIVVLITAIITSAGISIFVLPKLIVLFESFKNDLPVSTKILLFAAQTMKDYGIVIFGGLIAFIFVIRMIINFSLIKPKWHNLLLSLPIYGPFLQNTQLTALCRNIGVMLKSGLTLISALEIEEKASNNLVFKEYLKKLRKSVLKGKAMSTELTSEKYTKIPAIVTKMISVGEKTGKLDEVLLYLGEFFEEEVDNTAKNLTTTLEPVILLGLGLVVGFLALAIITPIYQLTGSIGKK